MTDIMIKSDGLWKEFTEISCMAFTVEINGVTLPESLLTDAKIYSAVALNVTHVFYIDSTQRFH